MNVFTINTPFNIELNFGLANFGHRLLAWFIDFAVLCIFNFVVMYFMFDKFYNFNIQQITSGDLLSTLAIVLLIIPSTFYHFLMQYFWDGASIGKKIMRIKVMNMDGGAASLSQILTRNLLCITNIGLGFCLVIISNPFAILGLIFILSILASPDILAVIVSKKKQKLGDIAAGTIVVLTDSEININKTIYVNLDEVNEYQLTYHNIHRLTDNEINGIQKIIENYKGYQFDYLANLTIKLEEKIEQQRNEIEFKDFFQRLVLDYNYYHQRK